MTQDAQFIATVLEAAADPERRAAIVQAAQLSQRSRMGTAKQAADILGTCTRTVERYARNGAFPRVHLSPRKVRYPLDQVERYARQGMDGVS